MSLAAPAEPDVARGHGPLLRAFLATRPAFLTVTAVGVLLGWACAAHTQAAPRPLLGLLTMLFALAAHAGANVVNDYHDVDTDAANSGRLYPYTGGSRFIQNGVMSRAAVGRLGYGLLLAVIGAGLWLVTHLGVGLLAIGCAGLTMAWAYSAPPLRLAARGLGEGAVAAGWLLLVVGSDFVQRGHFAALPALAGLAYGLMVANLLFINQFPDLAADAAAGKRTLVVRLGAQRAVAGYAVLALLAGLVVAMAVWAGVFGPFSLAALLALAPAARAYRGLRRHAQSTQELRPAIRDTILAAHVFGLVLAAALYLQTPGVPGA